MIAKGLAVAIPMFGVFAAHAFLSEATYETTAKITLTKVPGMEAKVPAPLAVLRELQDAALDQATLDRLVSDRVDKETPRAKRDEEAHRIRMAFSIDTRDARTYSVTFRDSDAARAASVCNLLAGRALRHATRPVPIEPEAGGASERQQRMTELLAFLGQHPEVASVGPGSSAADEDTVAKALLTERTQIDYQLRRLPSSASDNPYADPSPRTPDRATLERRLADINAILAQRKTVAEQRDREKPKVDPAIEAELLTRLRAVHETPLESKVEERPRFTAKLARATLPLSPIKPDRPRVLIAGALVGLAAGLIFVVGRVKVAAPRKRTRERDPVAKVTRVSQSAAQPRASQVPLEPVAGTLPAPPALPALPALPEAFPGSPRLLPAAPSESELSAERSAPLEVQPFVTISIGHAEVSPNPVVNLPAQAVASAPEPVRAEARRSSAVPPAYDGPQTKQGPAAELYERPKQIVDVEAVTIERGGPRAAAARGSDAPPARGSDAPLRIPSRRVTQSMGSPPERKAPLRLESDEGTRPLPDILHLLDGYTDPTQAAPTNPPPRASAPPPRAEERPSRSSSSAPPSGRVFVTALPPPMGWQVDPSLHSAGRQALARDVSIAGEGGCFVVGVTGPNVESKGRVAAELALALAEQKRVLLLEGDFQVPTIHQCMRLEMSLSTGYSHQLRVRVLDEHGDGRLKVVECSPTLHVLAEGVMRSPGMILSREFEDSVIGLRAWYDVIVVNGPPTSAVVDLQALASVADGVVLVGSHAQPPALFRSKPVFAVRA